MPNKIKKYLNEIDVATEIEGLFKKYEIEEKKEEIIIGAIEDYLGGAIEKNDLASELEEKANLDFSVALDFVYDLIDKILPLLPKEAQKAAEESETKAENKEKNNLQEIIKEIKKEANLKINEKFEKRFENIIFNWFRDVRDDSETIAVLSKSHKVGGLDFDQQEAQDLINILKRKKTKYAQRGIDVLNLITQELEKEEASFRKKVPEEEEIDVEAKVKLPQEKEKITEDVTIDQLLEREKGGVEFEELAKKEAIKRELGDKERVHPKKEELAEVIEEKEEFLESKEELAPPAPAIEKEKNESNFQPSGSPQSDSAQAQSTASQPAEPEPAEPEPAESSQEEINQPLIKKIDQGAEGRPKVEDVKFTRKLVGPIEELSVFKTEDFRRLSKDPQEAVNKIIVKLDLLEDESIAKRVQGIKALKSSPLYKIYADIMNQAIKEGKSFEKIVEDKDTFSLDEFKAIMDLNKKLKY